jgi:hypothetical protein
MTKRLDLAALVSGLTVAAFGVILLMDASGDLHLRYAALAPIAAFMAGAALVAVGLTRRG